MGLDLSGNRRVVAWRKNQHSRVAGRRNRLMIVLHPQSVDVALRRELKGKFYRKGVDLGCGWGAIGKIVRSHVNYLIGVDFKQRLLEKAALTRAYNELVFSDIRDYQIPYDADVIFLIEVIEHIPHSNGEQLLSAMANVPSVFLSTPQTYFRSVEYRDGHVTLWTEEELQRFGYKTRILHGLFQKPTIFATRHESYQSAF